jgi:hypothetical protein
MNNQTQKIYIAIGFALTVLSVIGLIIYSAIARPVNPVIIILLVAGFFVGIWLARKGVVDRYKLLKANGYKILAKILYISLERVRVPIGGNTGPARPVEIYRIICEGQDPTTQTIKTYKGSDMNLAPNINVASQPNLDIFVDKNNPDNYWVDISKIPVKVPRLGSNYQLQLQTGQNFYKSVDGVNYTAE